MADFDAAFEVVMKHEDDPIIKGKITRNNDGRYANKLSEVPDQFQSAAVSLPNGKWYYGFTRTRYGVDERAHPELRNGGFYSVMPADKAFAVAKSVFHQYWKFDSVADQTIATKLFDASINAGPKNALEVMQRALNRSGHGTPTWQWGPTMLAAINGTDSAALLNLLREEMKAYYGRVAKSQGLAEIPGGWLARAAWPIEA